MKVDVRDAGSVPGLERSPGGGNSNALQYSGLENPMDRGACWATVHGVAKSQTRLKWLSTHACMQVGLSPAHTNTHPCRVELEQETPPSPGRAQSGAGEWWGSQCGPCEPALLGPRRSDLQSCSPDQWLAHQTAWPLQAKKGQTSGSLPSLRSVL